MGDIGEGPAVDECGIIFERLHQVGREGVLEQHRHRAGGLHLRRGDCPAVAGIANDDAAETLL